MFSDILSFIEEHREFYSYSLYNGTSVVLGFGLDSLLFLFVLFLTVKLVFDVMESYL